MQTIITKQGTQKKLNPKHLLKNKYPELRDLWDKEKNDANGIDFDTISSASKQKVAWLCPTGNREHDYIACVHTRKNSNTGKISGCKTCLDDSNRFQDKKLVEEHIKQYTQTQFSVELGDQTELYIENLLKDMNYYQNVKGLGSMCADADISVMYNNSIYYAQVKTLSHIKDDRYMAYHVDNYPDNMLIIMVNEDRTRFALDFAKNIKGSNISLAFAYSESQYKNIMYTDLEKFKIKLKELMILSCTTIKFSGTAYKEFLMLQRLELYCISKNINYKRNTTNGNAVDGNINQYRFQAKYTSLNDPSSTIYVISSHKRCGTLNGQVIYASYEVDDFDYVILEVGGIKGDEHKYENNFCIIPTTELINQNILRSDICNGKKKFTICPPDYKKEHWSKKYWNNIPKEWCVNTLGEEN